MRLENRTWLVSTTQPASREQPVAGAPPVAGRSRKPIQEKQKGRASRKARPWELVVGKVPTNRASWDPERIVGIFFPEKLTTEAHLVEHGRSAFQAGRGSGSRFRGRCFSRSAFDHFTTTAGAARTTVAAIAAVAAVATTTVAAVAAVAAVEQPTATVAAVAAIAAVATVATDTTRTGAATTITAHATVATVTAVTTMTGHRGLLATEQRDADDREEDRDSKDYDSIHSRFLQVTSQVPKH